MSTKKQMVHDTMNRKKTGYIPVVPKATAFALENSSYDPERNATDPETNLELDVCSGCTRVLEKLVAGNWEKSFVSCCRLAR